MAAAALPSRVGRYEIAGRLAQGGMAEVLLGRLRGPHGFDRPVVIKRILPHLVARPDIVEMFLAEARTIANIRHPNLVQVHELGRNDDNGELFMAMEYLEGESIAGLCRRLAVRGEHLDFALAAHVIAEACAGLHAAHEAVGSDRRPLEIVHRDVSPQNLFVSYSGAVHVIDFGIARTAQGVRHTDDGSVRGKVEYFAPEQLSHTTLDRRVDVFALGIVLFELASGRRLFRRPSAAESMAAILREDAPRLRSVRPESPPELESICARALRRDAAERFPTALEMRKALLTFARRHAGPEEDLDEQLAHCMRRLFADRAAEKATMLERARSSDLGLSLPLAEADETVELPSVTGGFTSTIVPDPTSGPTETAIALAATVVSSPRNDPSDPRAASATMTAARTARPVIAQSSDAAPTFESAEPSPGRSRGRPLLWAAMTVPLAAAVVLLAVRGRPPAPVARSESPEAPSAVAPPSVAAAPPTVATAAVPSASVAAVVIAETSVAPRPPAPGKAARATRPSAPPPARASAASSPAPAPTPTIW